MTNFTRRELIKIVEVKGGLARALYGHKWGFCPLETIRNLIKGEGLAEAVTLENGRCVALAVQRGACDCGKVYTVEGVEGFRFDGHVFPLPPHLEYWR